MNRDGRLEVRLGKDLLEMIKNKCKERDSTMTEYIEELVRVNLGLDDLMVPAPGSRVLVVDEFEVNPITTQKFDGVSATSEHQKRLELGKAIEEKFNRTKEVEKIPLEKLELDMEEQKDIPKAHYVLDEDLPSDEFSQVRVVGRHKK